jgi:hypothetical protein
MRHRIAETDLVQFVPSQSGQVQIKEQLGSRGSPHRGSVRAVRGPSLRQNASGLVLLSFDGPARYARAGRLGVWMIELTAALAEHPRRQQRHFAWEPATENSLGTIEVVAGRRGIDTSSMW